MENLINSAFEILSTKCAIMESHKPIVMAGLAKYANSEKNHTAESLAFAVELNMFS